jgi:hypothetical protein
LLNFFLASNLKAFRPNFAPVAAWPNKGIIAKAFSAASAHFPRPTDIPVFIISAYFYLLIFIKISSF